MGLLYKGALYGISLSEFLLMCLFGALFGCSLQGRGRAEVRDWKYRASESKINRAYCLLHSFHGLGFRV